MNSENKQKPIYLDKNAPIEERVEDLLARMTMEEKVHQMVGMWNWKEQRFFVTSQRNFDWRRIADRAKLMAILKKAKFSPERAKKYIGNGLGQLSMGITHFTPKTAAERANQVQKFAKEKTRLGIPIIIHDECLHGCMAINSTSFPQSIALASMWDDKLMQEIAVTIGKETRARGIRQCLSPTINIARDPRCGRTEETYGEDPYLTSRIAIAFVKGIQSQGVVTTPKHYAANFVGDGGRDSNEIHFSERILREIYFPAFEACVKEANALSIMAAYNSLDGVPCSSNKWLLTNVLRKEWGFKGFVVSDYFSVVHIYEKHKVANTKAEAAKQAAEAGLDIELPNINCFEKLTELVKRNKISIETINKCVRRILWVKFYLGLFEEPYVNPKKAEKICDCAEHRQLALKAAQKSIVLLKNNKNILPLKNIKSIAVIGPNADEPRLGGYSCREPNHVVTPLEGIKNRASKKIIINFAQGCTIKDKSEKGFESAVSAAEKSDIAILFMGNSDKTEGEARDRSNLNLPGAQEELIKEIAKTDKPVIVVLTGGSVITMGNWINKVQAVIEAWYPGEEGGNAIADILFGNCNPSGHLPITFPKTTGQLPLYYNYKPSGRDEDYVDLRGKQPLFPFGFGLSYTTFKYSNLKIAPKKIHPCGKTTVSVEVKNTGKYEGNEVVQLYLRDTYSSIARPVKELKGFKKITLKPGEKKKVEFILTVKELRFLDRNMEYVVEPGTFKVMVGPNSAEGIKGKFRVV
ncbi:MAG: glycoside hydrolase family 3 N-terminal domain-containing protein [Candidatus Ratteibacteria bacterium]|nr:glycoside hydrolase family 3 N-terminal domain-containing protein [Candidatus Ratteibacteria bacterium]